MGESETLSETQIPWGNSAVMKTLEYMCVGLSKVSILYQYHIFKKKNIYPISCAQDTFSLFAMIMKVNVFFILALY